MLYWSHCHDVHLYHFRRPGSIKPVCRAASGQERHECVQHTDLGEHCSRKPRRRAVAGVNSISCVNRV